MRERTLGRDQGVLSRFDGRAVGRGRGGCALIKRQVRRFEQGLDYSVGDAELAG